MNRRGFLKRFGIGVTAALALASLPEAAIQALTVADAGKRCACEYLRRVYNAYVRGRGVAGFPIAMHVSPGLFAAFEGELPVLQRFGSAAVPDGVRSLMFKGTPLFADPKMTGWDVRFTDAPPRDVEYRMNTTGAVYA